MTRSRTIIVVGSFALVVLLGLSWLLVLSPRLGKPAEIAEQTESVQMQTTRLQAQIAQLQALQRDLPAQVARFQEGRENFPTSAEIPATLDQIRAAAARAGVRVETLTNGTPAILGAEAAAVAPAPADGEQPAADGATGAAAPTTTGGLASMAVSVSVNGSYAEVTKFLQEIQNLDRAWLVDTVNVQGGQDGGTVTLTASGAMYVVAGEDIEIPGTVTPSPAAAMTTPTVPAAPAA